LVLQYSDDFLSACGDDTYHSQFAQALKDRFNIEWQPRADWYLQAQIQQDKHGNIYLDQQRYAKSIVQRYIPTVSMTPTDKDKSKFASPLPSLMVFHKSDRSPDKAAVKELELKYGFHPIEAIASLNYLANTAFEELFAIRKLCTVMSLPGEIHFLALLHLLHHIGCHPPQALCYYKDIEDSPLYSLITTAKLEVHDPTLLAMCDSSWGDCEDHKSTGCYMIFYQGGLIDASSFVPHIVAMSSAEAEICAMCVAAMVTCHFCQVYCDIMFNNPSRPLSIPILSDSKPGIISCGNDRDTT
jgi:hypothetical protein